MELGVMAILHTFQISETGVFHVQFCVNPVPFFFLFFLGSGSNASAGILLVHFTLASQIV